MSNPFHQASAFCDQSRESRGRMRRKTNVTKSFCAVNRYCTRRLRLDSVCDILCAWLYTHIFCVCVEQLPILLVKIDKRHGVTGRNEEEHTVAYPERPSHLLQLPLA